MQFGTSTPCIVRGEGDVLQFVGPPDDPRAEAVKRMNSQMQFGKMPWPQDVEICEGTPVIDEARCCDPIIYIEERKSR